MQENPMKLEKNIVSSDEHIYQAWPDLTMSETGRLLCVFTECAHHVDRDCSRIMLTSSTDRGHSWRAPVALTPLARKSGSGYYNNARIMRLTPGRLGIVVDWIGSWQEQESAGHCVLFFSHDDGESWTGPIETPACGIVPDKIAILPSGRWLLLCHTRSKTTGKLFERLWFSDDAGSTWQGPVTVGEDARFNLCEASVLQLGPSLVAFMRENSGKGYDCYKTISHDGGESWTAPIAFPLPGCHRPVSGLLHDGRVFITYRFVPGGKSNISFHNFFCAVSDCESALALSREGASARIIPLDYDNSPISDTGYSGWVQFDDDSLYIVNYRVGSATHAYIQGYRLTMDVPFVTAESQKWNPSRGLVSPSTGSREQLPAAL